MDNTINEKEVLETSIERKSEKKIQKAMPKVTAAIEALKKKQVIS